MIMFYLYPVLSCYTVNNVCRIVLDTWTWVRWQISEAKAEIEAKQPESEAEASRI